MENKTCSKPPTSIESMWDLWKMIIHGVSSVVWVNIDSERQTSMGETTFFHERGTCYSTLNKSLNGTAIWVNYNISLT